MTSVIRGVRWLLGQVCSRRGFRLAMLVATLASLWLSTFKLRLSSDLTDLFPNRDETTMLMRFLRGFGGGDLGVILVRGEDPAAVEAAATALIAALRDKPMVARVLDSAPPPKEFDPTLAWAYSGPTARDRLKQALSPEGMRERLDGTRELLLAPGASEVAERAARDPLRLAMIPWELRMEVAAGVNVGTGADGAFVGDGGRARLVILEPRGSAFQGRDAARFVSEVREAMEAAQRHELPAHAPAVTMDLTGGHAIADATASLLRRDMIVSATLSTVLASLVFLLTFRRMRALFAVLPPLGLGTLWTTGIAAFFPTGLSAIATAFAAVVVGVGVDTGVHVYAKLLEGRRQGLTPAAAARFARETTWRPTLLAALAAGFAFAALLVSDLPAVRQLGVLCGAGEVLTAIGILLVTPEIGAWLERGAPPAPKVHPWTAFASALTRTRRRAIAAIAVTLTPFAFLAAFGWPSAHDTLVAIRPQALAPLATQREIYRIFGSKEGQWLAVTADASPERAAERADRVAERLDRLATAGVIDGFDALTNFAPAPPTQEKRLAERDALALPEKRRALEAALLERGFDASAFSAAFASFEHPSHAISRMDPKGPLAWIVSRHMAREGGETLVVSYVRPTGDPAKDAQALAAIREADPATVVTGYHHLETALRHALGRDLPIVAILALVLVVVTLRAALRRGFDVFLTLGTIAVEVGAVAALMRIFHVRLHVYDALVLPVLIGITMDESMFLLHAARAARAAGSSIGDAIDGALRSEGPLVASTALTTAAGFAALLACRFEGLFDLGAVGALGSALGLLAALIVIPAGLRLARGHASE
ncbi:MMPL family transporter [Pendulispora albinea]|uniref:MMPL family transporter n=1 Tax=Pendulispora albinea TaxID=2741071 RepID=A0ABZ2LUW7_9BACT